MSGLLCNDLKSHRYAATIMGTQCTSKHCTALHTKFTLHCNKLRRTAHFTAHFNAHFTSHCTAHCNTLHNTQQCALHCNTLHSTALQFTALNCTALNSLEGENRR